jgi:hypothetical protein
MTDSKTTGKIAGNIVLIASLISFAYAIFRYHIFGPVPWKDLAFFTFNKGLSLSAFVLLAINFSLGPLKNLGLKLSENVLLTRKTVGMTGFLMVVIHVFMSFLLFTKDTYGKFYQDDNSLTLLAGLSMLGGVLSFVVLWAYNLSFQTFLREDKSFITFITSRNFYLFAMLLTAAHLFFMGYKGWMTPGHWHGGLPPISLVSFVLFIIMFFLNLFGKEK